jgi:hypothetical protein
MISLKATDASSSLRERVRLLGSRVLPHDTTATTCPPAPLPTAERPLIIVASLMRSGTHLLLDSLFNNFSELRRVPLFLDFDAYERTSMPIAPLQSLRGAVVKTHYPETPLAPPYQNALETLASKAFIFIPRRSAEEVRRSLAKWGMEFSTAEFAELEERFEKFWSRFSPSPVEFRSLLEPSAMQILLAQIAQKSGLKPPTLRLPVMPAHSRAGVYIDKLLTRILGRRAPRINTTIGYRLPPKRRP